MNAAETQDEIAARLYLHAVLPAFEELGRVSPRAQALIADWHCAVEFAVCGGDGAAVRFQGGTVSVLQERCADAAISLFFFSTSQLVKQFEGRFSLPLPRRGIFRLASLYRFHRLGIILQEELEQHPRLLLGVALASLQPLIAHDHHARELMRDCPEGMAELCIPNDKLYGWVEWRDGKIHWGRGHAPRVADVVVTFRDEQTALAALRGELDEWAAIGKGELKLRGLMPLAETLGLVMARADHYLERRTK
ncbi:MAG TPA: hypothetical protein VG754_00485 [Verrucomicrobiae bacterium]|nr:hypothetical protein [Verrucomicrobiae bacterium]